MNQTKTTRREFLNIVLGTCVTGPLVFGQGRTVTNAGPRPNLLIIQTDEHNFRTLGCYRKTLSSDQALVWGPEAAVETPHIDSLAEQGALCTRFYATTPVCSPSRASWVSGRYPQNTPVVTNNIPLDDDIVTFAEILAQQGYATGYAGKWHLDGTGKPQWEPRRRFGFTDNRYMFNRGHWKQLEEKATGPRVAARNANGQPSYGVEGATAQNFTTDFLADKTIDFIRRHKDQPFSYMVSIPDPHGPNTVRAPYDTMFDQIPFTPPRTAGKSKVGLPKWATMAKRTVTARALANYFGMVKCIDDNVGRILQTLRDQNLLDRTVVVFTADHGDLCGEHGRDNKGVPYEASARIPMILRYPAKVPAGTLVHEALTCVDFLPTALALMDVHTAGLEEGRDASYLFAHGKPPANWQDVGFFRGTGVGDKNWLAAVTKRYKVVYAPADDPWLFDLEQNPDEVVNYYEEPACRGVVRHLARALLDYGRRCHDTRIEEPSIATALRKAVT